MKRRILSKLPAACKPVSDKMVWVDGRHKHENYEWYSRLVRTYVDADGNKRHAGREPKTITPDVLRGSGHPPRSATDCIRVFMRAAAFEFVPDRDRGMARLKELCLECSAGVLADVRTCTVISCPLWAHRMGVNPHNFHKQHQGAKA